MPDTLVTGLAPPQQATPAAFTIPQGAANDSTANAYLGGFGKALGLPMSPAPAPAAPAADGASLGAMSTAAPITPQAKFNSDINNLYAEVLPREGSGPSEISPKGAIGRGQVLPSTAVPYILPGHDPNDPKVLAAAKQALLNPRTNELVSKTYLADLRKRYGDDTTAILVAYNAGPGVADRWLASGRDPAALPAETQRYIAPALSQQWAQLTPQEQALQRERQGIADRTVSQLTALQQQYAQEAAAAPAGSQERSDLIAQYRQQLGEMERVFWQKVGSPPVQKPMDMWHAFGSPAMVIAMLAGLMARGHATAALNAGAAVLNSIKANDKEQYQKQYQIWKDQTQLTQTMISMENQDIRNLLEDRRTSFDEKQAQLTNLVAQMGIVKEIGGVQTGTVEGAQQLLESRERAAQQMQIHADAIQAHNDAIMLAHEDRMAALGLRAQNPQTVAFQKFLQEHPNATADEIQQFIQRQHPARSGPAAAVQKYLADHPDATAEEVSQFVAHVRAEGAAQQAWTSGQLGNTTRSIGVALDHSDTLLSLGEALQNGDQRALNALKNTIRTEFGYSGPVDFNFAKQIVGDELVKAVMGNGAGTGEDRRGLQASFDAANSPVQLVGVIRTADALLKGQLSGLQRQHQASGLLESDFDKLLSPKVKTRLGGGAHYVGEIITAPNGKKYRVTGGDLSDPNVEPVP